MVHLSPFTVATLIGTSDPQRLTQQVLPYRKPQGQEKPRQNVQKQDGVSVCWSGVFEGVSSEQQVGR